MDIIEMYPWQVDDVSVVCRIYLLHLLLFLKFFSSSSLTAKGTRALEFKGFNF